MGRRRLRATVMALAIAITLTMALTSAASAQSPSSGGYWYQVKHGDTWYNLSRRTGVSFQRLWDANPAHHHRHNWLFYGHWLWIPASSRPAPQPRGRYWYQVKHGDTWYSLSRTTGISFQRLWDANPDHHHPHQWLFYGHRLWIPGY